MNKTLKINLSVPEDKEMTETERREYCAAISAVFPRLEKDIKREMYARLVFGASEADSWDNVLLNRGFLEGMASLLEIWRSAYMENESRNKGEEFDANNSINEI